MRTRSFVAVLAALPLLGVQAEAGYTGLGFEVTPIGDLTGDNSSWFRVRLSAQLDTPGDRLVMVYGDQTTPLSISTSGDRGFYQHPPPSGADIEHDAADNPSNPGLEHDTYVTIGSTDSGANPPTTLLPGWPGFGTDSLVIDSASGSGWNRTPPDDPLVMAGPDGKVLLAQLTAEAGSVITAVVNMQVMEDGVWNMRTGETVTVPLLDIHNVTQGSFHSTISQAILGAEYGNEIVLAPRTYHETIDLMGKRITLRSEDPTDPAVVAATIIDGGGAGSVVTCDSGESSHTVLDGLTITGGTGTYNGPSGPFGGGMYVEGSGPTVRRCIFTSNTANSGGGIYASNGSGPNVYQCTFSGNVAAIAGGFGGAIYCSGSSDPTIVSECTFSQNEAGAFGGGVFAYVEDVDCFSAVTVTDSTFSNNSAPWGAGIVFWGNGTVTGCNFLANVAGSAGGGMYTEAIGNCHNITVEDCIFDGNSAEWGGGLFDELSDGSIVVANCEFSNNSAETRGGGVGIGGGIAHEGNGNQTVVSCRFVGNSTLTGDGGALACVNSEPRVVNCLFAGNQAGDDGGAIGCRDQSDPQIINCTIADNLANDDGGGIYSTTTSEPLLVNTILWGNLPDQIVDAQGSVSTVGYCAVEGGWPGVENHAYDPLFLNPAGDNYRLAEYSPCVDAGINTMLPADLADLDDDDDETEPLPLDLDGTTRRLDDPGVPDSGFGTPPIVDMGAYERWLVSPIYGACCLPDDSCVQTTPQLCQASGGAYQGDFTECTEGPGCGPACPADGDGSGSVDVVDLLGLLSAWGTTDLTYDIAPPGGDGTVDVQDLLALLAAWGPCIS